MASIQEREAVKRAGHTQAWINRVNAMSDAQVTAIYIRLKAEGKL